MKVMQYMWNEKGSSSKTIVLAVIFVVLLLATFNSRVKTRKIEAQAKAATEVPLVELVSDEVYSIEIFELLSKTVLEKQNGKWVVGSASIMPNFSQEEKENSEVTSWDYADENAILQVLETVHDGLKNWDLVSVNSEKKIDFRIGPLGSKFTFKNEKGEVLTCVEVGEKAADFSGTYVSKCGEDEIYKIPGILDFIFKKDFNGWRSKQVFEIEKDKIVKFDMLDNVANTTVSITMDASGEWKGTAPGEFLPDKKKVDALLTSFSNYKAMGFPERMGPEEASITAVQFTATAYMDNGETYSLQFGEGDRGPGMLVRGSQKPFVYTANQSDIDNFNKTADYLAQSDEPAESEETSVPGE